MSSVLVHPKRFAEGLDNAALFSTDPARLAVNDSIWVSWTGETFRFMGRGRYSAAVYDLAPTQGEDEYWDVIISLDTAKEVSTLLKKLDGAGRKDTTIDVAHDDGMVLLMNGADVVATLSDAPGSEKLRPTEEYEGFYELLERITGMPSEPTPPASPIVFTRDVVKKLDKVRAGLPATENVRWELHHVVGATWIYRHIGDQAAIVVMLESCRDNLT